MKKISLFSRIIFILQAFVVLYPIVWIPIRILKIEVDILLPIIMYGIYVASNSICRYRDENHIIQSLYRFYIQRIKKP